LANPVLKRGSKGDRVLELQSGLCELGHNVGAIDGVFGPDTEDGVKQFQRAYNKGLGSMASWTRRPGRLSRLR